MSSGEKKVIPNRHYGIGIYILVMIMSISCNNSPDDEPAVSSKSNSKVGVHQKPPSSFSDTIVVDFPAAIFYNPDSLQLAKIKSISDTAVFESMEHDCFYQIRYSRRSLQQNWPGIKIIEIKNARYILFLLPEGKKECIDLDTQNDPCGILIFDSKKAPHLADMTNIDSELGFYFSN